MGTSLIALLIGNCSRAYRHAPTPMQRLASPCQHQLRRSHQAELVVCDQAIEAIFCRLKDFRRIATRYDKLAANHASAVALAAVIAF